MDKKKKEIPNSKQVKMPIPDRFMEQLRARRKEKGITQQRSLEDALDFAMAQHSKKIWF
jgi:hypothetical protein